MNLPKAESTVDQAEVQQRDKTIEDLKKALQIKEEQISQQSKIIKNYEP